MSEKTDNIVGLQESKGIQEKAFTVEQAKGDFDRAQRNRVAITDMYRELDAFDRGKQWEVYAEAANIPSHQVLPVTNYISVIKAMKTAALAVPSYTGKIRPLQEEDRDKAKNFNKMYEYLWQRLRVSDFVRDALERSRLLGTGITQVGWDDDIVGGVDGALWEGDLKLKNVDPMNFYIDPAAYSLEDANFVHIAERKSLNWLATIDKFKDKVQQIKKMKSPTGDVQRRSDLYHRADGQQLEESDGVVDFHTHYRKVPINDEEGNKGYRIDVLYYAESVELHRQEGIQPNTFPFAILYDAKQAHSFYGLSSCYRVLDLQKALNKIDSIIATHALLAQNPPKLYDKRSGLNPIEFSKMGNAPGHAFAVNGNPTQMVHYVQLPSLPPEIFKTRDELVNAIKEVSGINDFYTGQSTGSLQTAGGIEQMLGRATLRDQEQVRDLEIYVERLSRLILEFMKAHAMKQTMRMEDPLDKNEYSFMEYDPEVYSQFEFEFVLDISPATAMSREAHKQAADKLLEMQLQYQSQVQIITPEEYMVLSDLPGRDTIIKRMQMERNTAKAQEYAQAITFVQQMSQSGIPFEQAIQMAAEELDPAQQEHKLGNTKNTGTFQQRQAG